MTTLTLNRNMNAEDLFVAMNNGTYADLKASWGMDCLRAEWEQVQTGRETLGEKIRKLFYK